MLSSVPLYPAAKLSLLSEFYRRKDRVTGKKNLRADTTNKKAFYAFVNVIVGFPTPIPAEQGSITTFIYFVPILIFLKTIFPTLKTEGEIRSTI